jgi:DNA-binding GntR family transcriptional regulator
VWQYAGSRNETKDGFAMTTDEATVTKQPRRTALRQTTLMDSVYQEILARLQTGQIGPEDRVLDYEVAQEFECTRMPVRQALLRLVNEGYLVGTTRGFVTPALTAEDVREIFEVRRLLEPGAAASAALFLTDGQLAGLGAAYRKCRRSCQKRDIAMMMDANVEFRGVWLEAVQNVRLKGMILRFADHTRQVRHETMLKSDTLKLVADGMQVVLKGFVERNPVLVRTATQAFLDDAEQQYFLDTGDSSSVS